MTQARGGADSARIASLRARASGYVVDMVIFCAITTVIVVIAGAVLLVSTDSATKDPADADLYTFLAIIGLGTPIVWALLNVALLSLRGQTGGQYVAGVRLVHEGGGALSPAQSAAWWFCFNPLLFSWPMALPLGIAFALLISLVVSPVTVFIFGAVMVLCAGVPVAALVSAALDERNRALHDRVVGTLAVAAE